MSYLRAGYALKYFEGFSEAYIFHSSGNEELKDFVEDYDFNYEDNATFAELLISIISREITDEEYLWKLAGVLEKKLPGVKRRLKPLTADEFFELTNQNFSKK